MSSKNFKTNLVNLGVTWEAAPSFAKLQEIGERVVIGPNGCGKSRLLRALSSTLRANGIEDTDILYADFPEMAGVERKGIDKNNLTLLNSIFLDRRDTPIYDTLKLISSDPINGAKRLVGLSKDDAHCESAVEKSEMFLKPMFGEDFKLRNITDYFTEDKPLSPGQRSLFYMSVMLGVLAAYHANRELYILLDEPDQHLHAKSGVEFIKQIQEHLPKAKLWIATHSVHILTHFKFDEIIYIKNNAVQKNNSKMYDEICNDMIDTKGMQEMVSFTGLYGFYEFFRECFSSPDAESNINEDAFKKMVENVRKLGIKKVLDYGAGKGRFFKLLADIPNLEYHAFECFPEYHNELKKLLPTRCPLYTNRPELATDKFDAVLLINTLHEIPLTDWLTTLQTIKRILKEDGHLFFCETSPLITGEKVNSTGFLVLGAKEQSELFGVEATHLDQNQKLHFSIIPKNKIPVLTEEKLKSTLELLKETSFKNWDSKDKNVRNAAFYAVQHLNATKAIKELHSTFKNAKILAEKQRATELAPKNASHWDNLGVALYKMERYEEDLAATQKAVDLEPENALYQNNLGGTLHKLKRYEKALIADKKAVDLEPENALYQNNLGVTLHELKRHEEALAAQKKAVDLEPANALYQNNLGDTLNELKRYEEALVTLQKAVALKPNNPLYQKNLETTLRAMKE